MSIFRRQTAVSLIIICVAAFLAIGIGSRVKAATPWFHLWNSTNFSINTASAGSMTAAMTSAAANYNNSTDLNSAGGGVIQGYEDDFGAIGYIGYAYPSGALGNCYFYPTAVFTGNCNTSTLLATSAVTYFNTHHGAYPDSNWLARHEMGHVFGLYHPACTDPVTVMYTTNCAGLPSTLQNDEITWINSQY